VPLAVSGNPARNPSKEKTMTKLITDEQRAQLLANGQQSLDNENFDPPPVVKLFTPDADATWLLTEIDTDDHDHAFGLCDLGQGFPELGYVIEVIGPVAANRAEETLGLRCGKVGMVPLKTD
jgi:hypothetical protein